MFEWHWVIWMSGFRQDWKERDKNHLLRDFLRTDFHCCFKLFCQHFCILYPRHRWAGWKIAISKSQVGISCCDLFVVGPGFKRSRAGRQLTAGGEGWKGASRLRRGWQETDKDKMQGKRVARRFSGREYPFQRDTWQSVSYTQVFSPPLDWDESAGCEMSCDFDEK